MSFFILKVLPESIKSKQETQNKSTDTRFVRLWTQFQSTRILISISVLIRKENTLLCVASNHRNEFSYCPTYFFHVREAIHHVKEVHEITGWV